MMSKISSRGFTLEFAYKRAGWIHAILLKHGESMFESYVLKKLISGEWEFVGYIAEITFESMKVVLESESIDLNMHNDYLDNLMSQMNYETPVKKLDFNFMDELERI